MKVYTLLWHTDEKMSQPVAVLANINDIIPAIKSHISEDSQVDPEFVEVLEGDGDFTDLHGKSYEYATDGDVNDWFFTVKEFDLNFNVH